MSHTGKKDTAIVVVLVLIIVAVSAWFIIEYRYSGQLDRVAANELAARREWIAAIHARGPATLKNVPSIQAWMTFDYINLLFALPPGYIKTTLDITDTRYPRLAIEEYAENAHLVQKTVVTDVQNAVRSYIIASSTSATSTAAKQ